MTSPNLNQFFGGIAQKVPAEVSAGMKRLPAMERLHKRLAEKAGHLAPEKLLGRAEALLDIGLASILGRAFSGYRQLQEYADPQTCPPDRTYMVSLAEHRIRSRHRPALDVRLNGKTLESIGFEIDLELELKGVVLEIRGGSIRAIHTGECRGAGEVRCEGLLLCRRESKLVDLPGTIELAEEIPIVPA